jgi:hypothetical protein
MRTQTGEPWFGAVIILWGEFLLQMCGYKCFWEKIRNSFLLYKFEKEASKKEKIAKDLKPQKLERKIKQRKLLFRHYQSKTNFIFIFR